MSGSTVGEYELINCIAAGSQTQIWEVGRIGAPERYVMKLMLPQAFEDADAVRSLRHEAQVGTSFEHPNLITFHEFSATRSEAFIVMEYFRGANVKTMLKADLAGMQNRLRRVMEGACLGLAEMHAHGYVHKDVKPDNILANKAGEVKIIDFGLSVRVKSGLGKLLGGKARTIQGTRTYIAPETIRKQHPTPATDIYSLGVTLYEALTGSPPFKGTSPNDLLKRHLTEKPDAPSNIDPNITSELDQLVVWMLAKKPENRPASMTELYNAFRSVPMFREAISDKPKQENFEDSVDARSRLDSRADAMRSAGRRASGEPEAPKPKPKKPAPAPAPAPKPMAAPAASPTPAPPAAQPGYATQPPAPAAYGQQPGYPPPGYPAQQGYPQQPYPAQPYPQQPYPQQPYPQQPFPQQPYPQQPQTGQPYQQQPGQPQAPQQQPGQPLTPQQQPVPPQQPAQPRQPAAPPSPRPPATQSPQAPAQPPAGQGDAASRSPSAAPPPVRRRPNPQQDAPASEGDLPLMTELPDVS